MIAANHFYMLYRFRRELIEELQSRYEVIVAAPFQTGEEVFESMGIRCTETKMQRRRVQVLFRIASFTGVQTCSLSEKPDLVLTYAIKPNVYMGFLCTCYRIPFYATVQGLGSAFQRPWLSCVATFLYKLSFLRVQNVFFENQSNAVEFCRRHILPPEKRGRSAWCGCRPEPLYLHAVHRSRSAAIPVRWPFDARKGGRGAVLRRAQAVDRGLSRALAAARLF